MLNYGCHSVHLSPCGKHLQHESEIKNQKTQSQTKIHRSIRNSTKRKKNNTNLKAMVRDAFNWLTNYYLTRLDNHKHIHIGVTKIGYLHVHDKTTGFYFLARVQKTGKTMKPTIRP